jgi:uncharacterized membrane protein YGL010W
MMQKIKLNPEWSRLMETYRLDHQNPINQACHTVGIPLIAGSIPVGATVVGLPLAAGMFTVGWGFQFVGHAFEGKKPSFVDDRRSLVVGLLWWMRKVGLDVVEETDPSAERATHEERNSAAL